MSNGGWTLMARFSNADSANWRTVVTGGMTGSATNTSNIYDML